MSSPPTVVASTSSPREVASCRDLAVLRQLTDRSARPRATFPLVLTCVTIAVVAMEMDAVPHYSRAAFFAGLALTVVLAIVVGEVVDRLGASLAVTLLIPAAFGAAIGVIVQSVVLQGVGDGGDSPLRDLGGLVDTTRPLSWIAGGVVLGGLPALLVSAFLVVAGRSIRRLTGHDASEGFGVAFTGFAGALAAVGLHVVDVIAVDPLVSADRVVGGVLVMVAVASSLALLVALVVDGARARFLRRVYAGEARGFEIVPAARFAGDRSLEPLVAKVGATSVLVRVEGQASYRAAAAEPIALVGETARATLRPLRRRRAAAAATLVTIAALTGAWICAHA